MLHNVAGRSVVEVALQLLRLMESNSDEEDASVAPEKTHAGADIMHYFSLQLGVALSISPTTHGDV